LVEPKISYFEENVKMDKLEKLIERIAVEDAMGIAEGLAKARDRDRYEVFVDVLKEKGYVVTSIKELEELKEKAWKYDELEY
jgi:tRNA splicing endonuclease